MYSKKTLRKYTTKANERVTFYLAALVVGILLRVSISCGNRKIGRVWNVSLPAIITCSNCSGCSELCYDIKAALQYRGTMDARARNLAILRHDRDEYFRQCESVMTATRKHKYFRWHVGGDIIDVDYFDRMVEIARRHPDWIYWTYTKHYMAVNRWIRDHGGNKSAIPANLHVMFSEWRGMEMVNPYGLPEFRVIFKDETTPADATWICPGNCDICKTANRGCLASETTHCHEH